MSLQKWGGAAALLEACTYIFGFVLFFVVLDSSGYEAPERYLEFIIQNRDSYFLGYLVSGIVFSFALIVLVQANYQRFKQVSPELMRFTAVVGYLWVFMVLSSSFIFLTGLEALVKYHAIDATQALTINRTVITIVDALGGGIELVGAVWVLAISYIGVKNKIYGVFVHYWGVLVGIAGVLTLFSGLSFLATNMFFEISTAIFGLGQIVWFILLGIAMLNDAPKDAE